jgi:hypothetical protein
LWGVAKFGYGIDDQEVILNHMGGSQGLFG